MNKKWLLIYVIVVIFLLSATTNNGFGKYTMLIPYVCLLFWISGRKIQNKKLHTATICISLFAVIITYTALKNPFFYPILSGGYVEVLEDGYFETFPNGDGGVIINNFVPNSFSSDIDLLGPTIKINKGDIFKVTGFAHRQGHGLVSYDTIVTEVGEFIPYFLSKNDTQFLINKPITAPWMDWFSELNYLPLLLIVSPVGLLL